MDNREVFPSIELSMERKPLPALSVTKHFLQQSTQIHTKMMYILEPFKEEFDKWIAENHVEECHKCNKTFKSLNSLRVQHSEQRLDISKRPCIICHIILYSITCYKKTTCLNKSTSKVHQTSEKELVTNSKMFKKIFIVSSMNMKETLHVTKISHWGISTASENLQTCRKLMYLNSAKYNSYIKSYL